mmetsp:Transcript_19772/g.42596  ORF Transcript_19772/g.42596 Transcript_19772/m.42596 type:complete len:144 (-) Transcript_19772:137-568(-)
MFAPLRPGTRPAAEAPSATGWRKGLGKDLDGDSWAAFKQPRAHSQPRAGDAPSPAGTGDPVRDAGAARGGAGGAGAGRTTGPPRHREARVRAAAMAAVLAVLKQQQERLEEERASFARESELVAVQLEHVRGQCALLQAELAQ